MPTTQLAKWGNSLALRIPKAVAEDAQLREGEPVTLTLAREGGLLIKSVRRKYRLHQLVSRITAKNRHGETGWGKPEGKESW
jgi:antitoxin MazE